MSPTTRARSQLSHQRKTTTMAAKDIFDRLSQQPIKERPVESEIPRGALLPPVVPPTDYITSSPTEQLLDFIVNRWPKPSIRIREILQFGPPSARNRKSAIALAETLAANGWLAPLPPTRQHNEKLWRIVRGPNISP